MDTRSSIEDTTIAEFAYLCTNYSFAAPLVTRESLFTTFDYLNSFFAVEIALDWRDIDVFILLVRLEDGTLPAGYYVEHRKRCRLYLDDVLQSIQCVSTQELASIRASMRIGNDRLTPDGLVRRIKACSDVLRNHLPAIVDKAAGRADFDSAFAN